MSCRFPGFVIPAQAGLRRQDAGANIDGVDGPKGALQEQRVIQFQPDEIKMDPGFRRDDEQKANGVARGCSVLIAILLGWLVSTVSAGAGPIPSHVRAPPDLHQRVGFDQELGAQVPLGAVFHDASGKAIHLSDLLHGKPALLVPGYFTCKTLCSVVRTGVANGVRGTGFTPGQQFDVVLVSIDPHETPADARHAQQMDAMDHPGVGVTRWHYLTGTQASIAPLMHSIGFRYMFDARSDQFDHATGIVVLTPDGKVSQYLFGVKFPAETLRLALVNASHGSVGNIIDRLVLLCCQYDTSTGRYTLTIHRIMQGLGISFAVLLAGFVLFLRRSEKQRKREEA